MLDLASLVQTVSMRTGPEDKAWIYLLAHARKLTPRDIKSRLWHRRRHEAHSPLRSAQLTKVRDRAAALDSNV